MQKSGMRRIWKVLNVMMEQMRLQQEEVRIQMQAQQEQMRMLIATLANNQSVAVHDVSKDQYDQLSKDVQRSVSDEDTGNTFAY